MADIQKIQELDTPKVDKFAKREEKRYAGRDYDKERKEQDGENGLKLDNLFFKIACRIINVLSFLFIILVAIWFWHLISPSCWRWLTHSEVQAIERILFASTLISLAGKYFSKYNLLNKS